MSINSFFGSIDDEEEIIKKNDIDKIVKSAVLIFQIKNKKEETDTIIKIASSKFDAFMARVNYLTRNKMDIDLFDLASESKRQLQVYHKGEKYYGKR